MPHFFHSAVMAAVLATAPPSAVTDAPPADAARLLGAWDCSGSVRGSTSTLVYTRADDATFALQASVHTAFGVTGNVTESFAYDRKSGLWTLTSGRSRFFDSMRLTAKGWTSSEWIFSGTESTQGAIRAIRILYASVSPDSFVRQHQTALDGHWLEDGTLTCRRARALATPSSRPSMQPAVAALPHNFPAEPPAIGTARTGATPTPLPIPGIVPAQVATGPVNTVRNAQGTTATPSGTHGPTVRSSSAPARFLPSTAPAPGTPLPSTPPTTRSARAQPSRVAARPAASPAAEPAMPIPPAQPSAARGASARATSAPSLAANVTARPSSAASRPAATPATPDARQLASAQPSAARIAAARPAIVTARSSPRPTASPPNEGDRAYRLTGNVWSCETLGGLPATHTYTRERDGEIKLHNVLTIAKREYGIDETYHFDNAKNVWATATGAGAYVGVAPKWLHDKWIFEGTMQSGNRRVPVQMVYSTLGEGAFRRDFSKLQDGTWRTFAAETCHRP